MISAGDVDANSVNVGGEEIGEVWIHCKNPNGVFAQHNPNVSCKHHKGAKMAHWGMAGDNFWGWRGG